MKVPTIEDFLSSKGCSSTKPGSVRYYYDVETEDIAELIKIHVQAALQKASEEVYHDIDIDWNDPYDYSAGHNGIKGDIDKDSILNAYPFENIK